MRVCFDENTPPVVARAIRELAQADAEDRGRVLEVCHANDIVPPRTPDAILIQAVADGAPGKAVLVTTDKAMRTRRHERQAFLDTGVIGIVLVENWNHASMWDRGQLTMCWWQTWIATAEAADPGSLWRCPYAWKPKRMNAFAR